MPLNYLQPLGTCSSPCVSPLVVNVPGTKGDTGAAGADGTDGAAAYTVLVTNFDMPAVGADEQIEVASTAAFSAGLPIYIETAGAMRVISVDDGVLMTVRNLGGSTNAAPTTTIAAGAKITPSGEKGFDGSGAYATGEFALPDATQDYSVSGLAFGFVPSQILLTISKPVGGLNLVPTIVEGSITADGFDMSMNGMTDSALYVVMYLAIP